VDWARTLRIDAPLTAALHERVAALARDGVRVRACGSQAFARTYVLFEGPQGADPSELQARLPDARWYGAAIIALAIEPSAPDALRQLLKVFGGPGAPAGVCGCEQSGKHLLLEFRPDVTPALLVRSLIGVELRRFNSSHRTEILTPLPVSVAAAIAAQGLQAPEIASDRILESLLGLEHFEHAE
jgi:hypothetical protein